ncbi:hypothetical protein RQP46_000894 [Phenoliferia psychrophenolica]
MLISTREHRLLDSLRHMTVLPYSQLTRAGVDELIKAVDATCATDASKGEALAILLPYYRYWDAQWWPKAGATYQFHEDNWTMLQCMDIIRFFVMKRLLQAQPNRLIEASPLAQRVSLSELVPGSLNTDTSCLDSDWKII